MSLNSNVSFCMSSDSCQWCLSSLYFSSLIYSFHIGFCLWMLSPLVCVTVVYFHCYRAFHYMDIPTFIRPFSCWWIWTLSKTFLLQTVFLSTPSCWCPLGSCVSISPGSIPRNRLARCWAQGIFHFTRHCPSVLQSGFANAPFHQDSHYSRSSPSLQCLPSERGET